MSIYKFIGALGLLFISIGIVNKKRFIQDILYTIRLNYSGQKKIK